jgi:hypothetical protein
MTADLGINTNSARAPSGWAKTAGLAIVLFLLVPAGCAKKPKARPLVVSARGSLDAKPIVVAVRPGAIAKAQGIGWRCEFDYLETSFLGPKGVLAGGIKGRCWEGRASGVASSTSFQIGCVATTPHSTTTTAGGKTFKLSLSIICKWDDERCRDTRAPQSTVVCPK